MKLVIIKCVVTEKKRYFPHVENGEYEYISSAVVRRS